MACLVALFVVLVVFVVSRLAIYGRRLAFLQSFEVDRQRFVASPGPSLHNEPSLVQGLQERVPDVKRLLDEARVPHPTFFYTEPVGYNRIRSGAAPSLDNVQHQTDADVIETTNVAVRQASASTARAFARR